MILRHTIIRLVIILFIIFFISDNLSAVTRGVRVVSKQGAEVYLYKDYHALVVGVGDYDRWPDLPNAVEDAKEVSAALKRLGFAVKEAYNPTSRELTKALNDMTYKDGREKNRAILFYFAGNGETETLADGTKFGYIIPKDCPLIKDDPGGFINLAISMKDIETYSLRIQSKHVLALFDSCFSGSLFSLGRAVPEDISEKSALPVRQYITAGNEDEPVPDRSMFKRCLLLGLEGDADLTRDGYITGSELGMYLSDKVVQYTRRAQHPQYGKINNPDLDRGDFIIKLADSGAMTTLSVNASVSGARVYVDGIEMGQTPLVDFALSEGNHQIRVVKEGYKPYEKDVHIDEDRTSSLYASLTPIRVAPRTGRLYVDTRPDNARIRILNITPSYHRGMELQAGRYHIEVSASTNETKRQWINLDAGEDKYVDMRLAEITPPPGPQLEGKTFTNSIGMRFVPIPNGTFMMGSKLSASEVAGKYGGKESYYGKEHPQHHVTISKPFYMQTTEVTQGQWKAIMGNTPMRFNGDNNPVEGVSWNDAQEFIRKLSRKEGTNKYRLPTEAEWEYACRAETTTPFYTGDCISTDQANYDGNYPGSACSKGVDREKTVEVGSFAPNAWGLYDMHGNVWEWCEDWYGNYIAGAVTDPKGPSSGSGRVLRGGSFGPDAGHVRSAYRLRCGPALRSLYHGFRIVRAQ